MRLGQLARKYNLSLPDIISYLAEVEPDNNSLHSNSKLNEQSEKLIAKKFNLFKNGEEENLTNAIEDSVDASEVNLLKAETVAEEDTLAEPPDEIEAVAESEVKKPSVEEGETIETDKLLELMESEETPENLDKFTLIKVPKKELSGLKIIGNIELPEEKAKADEQDEQPKKETKVVDENSKQRRRLVSDEELEERRLKAKKKKEEQEERTEKLRIEHKKKEEKAIREAHYQQKMRNAKPKQTKQKTKSYTEDPLVQEIEPAPKPKTAMGRFLKWLNT